MPPTQWTDDDIQLFRSLLHFTSLGGLNTKDKIPYKEMAEIFNLQSTSGIFFNYHTLENRYHGFLKPMWRNDLAFEKVRLEHVARETIEIEKETQLFRGLLYHTKLGGLNVVRKLSTGDIANKMTAAYNGERTYNSNDVYLLYRNKLLPKFEINPAYGTLRSELTSQTEAPTAHKTNFDWADEEEYFLQAWIHYTQLGGRNVREPPFTWLEIADGMNAKGGNNEKREYTSESVRAQYYNKMQPKFIGNIAYKKLRSEWSASTIAMTKEQLKCYSQRLECDLKRAAAGAARKELKVEADSAPKETEKLEIDPKRLKQAIRAEAVSAAKRRRSEINIAWRKAEKADLGVNLNTATDPAMKAAEKAAIETAKERQAVKDAEIRAQEAVRLEKAYNTSSMATEEAAKTAVKLVDLQKVARMREELARMKEAVRKAKFEAVRVAAKVEKMAYDRLGQATGLAAAVTKPQLRA